MGKPKPLPIDGEVFKVSDEADGLYFIDGAGMCLSPYEAQELADWLIKAVKWMENNKNNTGIM